MSDQQSKQPGSSDVSRRQALRAGAALAGLSTLGARVVAADLPAPAASAPRLDVRPEAKRLIVVFLEGGLSHIDSLDPKPDAPEGVRGAFGTIETAIPGVRLSEHLPELARRLDQVTLVRGIDVGEFTHGAAQAAMLSGWPADAKNPAPTYGAVIQKRLGRMQSSDSTEVDEAGGECLWQVGANLDESYGAGGSGWLPGLARETRWQYTRDYLEATARTRSENRRLIRPLRRLVSHQVAAAEEIALTGARSMVISSTPTFDDHEQIYGDAMPCLEIRLKTMDDLIVRLLDRLQASLPDTLLAVLTDFGRDPYINAQGGRHHWPRAGAAILAGAGVPKGVVVGATDRLGGEQVESPIGPGDLGRWILGAFGLRPEPRPGTLEEGRLV